MEGHHDRSYDGGNDKVPPLSGKAHRGPVPSVQSLGGTFATQGEESPARHGLGSGERPQR